MEKIEFTKEQIEKIAEGISVICFRSNSEASQKNLDGVGWNNFCPAHPLPISYLCK